MKFLWVNIVVSSVMLVIIGTLFYKHQQPVTSGIDEMEIYVMQTNVEINENNQWQEIPIKNGKFRNDSLEIFVTNIKMPVLMLRIKETSCQTCVFNELSQIKELKKKGIECVLLTTYASLGMVKKILRMKGCSDVRFFNASYDCLYDWYVEQLEMPYYFVLHPDKKASDFFVPDKSQPQLTESYFKSITRLFPVNGIVIN